VGDTNTEYDPTGHILVTLEGNFEEEEPTREQMQATRNLVGWLAKKFKVPSEKIKTHKDYAQTACPGKNLQLRAEEIRKSAK
jgi:N-acetyl-anhydromuramyl-L-alanine amidase AmpD